MQYILVGEASVVVAFETCTQERKHLLGRQSKQETDFTRVPAQQQQPYNSRQQKAATAATEAAPRKAAALQQPPKAAAPQQPITTATATALSCGNNEVSKRVMASRSQDDKHSPGRQVRFGREFGNG